MTPCHLRKCRGDRTVAVCHDGLTLTWVQFASIVLVKLCEWTSVCECVSAIHIIFVITYQKIPNQI